MTNIPSGSSLSPAAAASGASERRRAPRIAPLSADIYSAGAGALQESLRCRISKRAAASRGRHPFFYLDHHFQHNAVKVLPGEYFVGDENMVIMTVLGSCIAACLWDSRAHVGGMNHFMLPDGDLADASGRYGSYAMELLINEMLKLGARRETMQAKIFGGAQVMHNFTTMNVGERNTNFVLNYLHTERIPIVSRMCWIFIRARWFFSPSPERPWSSDWHMHIPRPWWLRKCAATQLRWPRPPPAVPWICFEEGVS